MKPEFFTEHVPEHVGPVYLCPLCVTATRARLFKREAVEALHLTAEHAPPKHAGGRAIALTCAQCNHTAGSELDSHAQIAQRVSGGVSGAIVERPARITLGDKHVNATLSLGPDGMKIIGAPERNSLKAHAAFFEQLAKEATPSGEGFNLAFELHRDRFDPTRASVSWLRAAYIVTFAKFGYRFILDRAFHNVRQKIREPNSELVPLFSITAPGSPAERALVMVHEPTDLRGSVAVRIGPHLVLLPGPSDETFYQRIADKHGKAAKLSGKQVAWPQSPELLFDFDRRANVTAV
jgi:hypothetical protein